MNIVNGVNSKRTTKSFGLRSLLMPFAFALLLFNTACHDNRNEKDNFVTPSGSSSPSVTVVKLVADTAGFGASRIDTNLVNGWGITVDPVSGNFWISSADAGRIVVYDQSGVSQRPPVAVPFQGDNHGGTPTGIIYNATSGFIIPVQGVAAKYIAATEEGTIVAWTTGNQTATVVDNSASGSVYKGITMAMDAGFPNIYVANFGRKRVDVYDQNFGYMAGKQLIDPNIPSDFSPFNVANIDGNIYVAYAKLDPSTNDEIKGAGLGYISVFNPNGNLINRFASQGSLNAPWAMVKAPSGFGAFGDAILVGNFGDGHITVFNANGGNMGQLQTNNTPIAIDGLWGLTFGPSGNLYFAAGPDDEDHGMFGYITAAGGANINTAQGGHGGIGGIGNTIITNGGTSSVSGGGISGTTFGTGGGGSAGSGGGASIY